MAQIQGVAQFCEACAELLEGQTDSQHIGSFTKYWDVSPRSRDPEFSHPGLKRGRFDVQQLSRSFRATSTAVSLLSHGLFRTDHTARLCDELGKCGVIGSL